MLPTNNNTLKSKENRAGCVVCEAIKHLITSFGILNLDPKGPFSHLVLIRKNTVQLIM